VETPFVAPTRSAQPIIKNGTTMSGRLLKLSNSFNIVLILIALLLIAMTISFTFVAHSFLVKEELHKAGRASG
jgi:hypothetical protein